MGELLLSSILNSSVIIPLVNFILLSSILYSIIKISVDELEGVRISYTDFTLLDTLTSQLILLD